MSLVRRDSPGEANPHRPNVPESVRDISADLYYFLQEQAATLRESHELQQAGDSSTPWEHMTYVDDQARFTLGSLGRFTHPTYGLITCRYVQFSDMDNTVFAGSPVGLDTNIQEFNWLVTNKYARSNPAFIQGVAASYTIPKQGQYGWIIVNGVAVQDIGFGGDEPSQFTSLAWSGSGVAGPNGDSIALGRYFGKNATQNGLAWVLPGGSVYVDVLSLQEAKTSGIDNSAVEERLYRLEQAFKGISYSVDVKLNESDIKLDQQNELVNQTAQMISRRIEAIDLDGIRSEITEQLNLTATYANKAKVDSSNAQNAALTSFTQLSATNIATRTASIRSDEAGYYAESATTSANAAETSRNAADTSAAASATSASNAATSETNAGTSATAAQNSATSANTSAGTAATQAGIATTQAGNASTSAGNASTSASQASTSATNAAGSATNAASSATTATGAATTATTQAGIATTQAGVAATQATNAGTYASNASTSASQASTSATNAGTSATNASNSASAANTSSVNAASSATTAGTQATNAATQAGNAATSATGAAGSATTATNQATAAGTSATNAATSATNAGNSATAANTSAVNASSSATNAANSATAAAGSATTATNQANAAATSASNASTSATNAGTSASSANTSATNASTSATTATTQAGTATTQAGVATTQAGNAAGSATTAGTQATNAANSATGAAGSATTATTQAGIATTQASNANTSATNASNSATAAGVSAGNASTSATTASNSATTALLAAGTEFPATFAGDSAGYTDNPGIAIAPQVTLGANVSFVTVTAVGRVWQALGTQVIAHMARRALYTNAVFNLQYTARNTTVSIRTYLSFRYVVFNGTTNLADIEIERPQLPNDGTWYTSSVLSLTAAAIIAAYPTATHIAPYISTAFGDNNTARVTQVSSIVNRDLTAQTQATNAASSATAAATSASTASTQASNAGTSATSANTSATNAATSASGASSSATTATTQASAASSSSTAAAGSATTATTQASNASTSASNAATSATAASTSATNASTSASSASTSAILAASAGIGALNSNPVFAKWTGISSAPPDDWPIVFSTPMTISRVTGTESPNALQIATSGISDTYLHQYYPANTGLANMTRGIYILEVSVELVAGALTAAGIRFTSHTSGNVAITDYDLKLAVDPDIFGVVNGAGAVGTLYRFQKVIRVSDATIAKGMLAIITNYSAFGTATSKTLKWHRVAIRAASDAEAAVISTSGVTVDVAARISTASFAVATVAGSATAAIRLESKALGGAATSSLALEAEEIQLYNVSQSSRQLAMKMSSGNVIITGDLDVGKGVRVGTLRIPVALQSFQLQAGDGDVISFGTDLGRTPQLLFDTDRLAVKTASQTYDVRVTGLTSTGFTMYAKIITPSSSGTYGTAASTDAGAGVTPRYQANKSNVIDAASGYYNFAVSMSLTFSGYVAGEPGSGQAYGAVDCYVRPASGAWTYVGTISQNFISSSNGTLSKTLNGSVYYGSAIGLDAGLTEFGVVAVSGSVTSFSVSYTGVGTSGSATSATPSGEKVTVTVIPQNV